MSAILEYICKDVLQCDILYNLGNNTDARKLQIEVGQILCVSKVLQIFDISKKKTRKKQHILNVSHFSNSYIKK